MSKYKVKSASLSDLEPLLEIAVEFFYESDNKDGGLDLPLYQSRIVEALDDLSCDTILVMDGERIAAYSVIFWVRDYTLKRIGEMALFYVRPDYRGKNVSRILRDAMESRWDDWGCFRSFVEAASGVQNSVGLFSNLWKKAGYKNAGVILMKDRV